MAAFAATAVAVLSGGTVAHASCSAADPWLDNRVQASNGSTAIFREGQSGLHPVVCEPTCTPAAVTDVQWSADGKPAKAKAAAKPQLDTPEAVGRR